MSRYAQKKNENKKAVLSIDNGEDKIERSSEGLQQNNKQNKKRECKRRRASPVCLDWCCPGFDGPDAEFARSTSSDGNSTGLLTTIDGPENLSFWRTRYSGVCVSNGQEKISILRLPVWGLLLAKILEIKFCFKLNAVDGVIVKNGRIRFFWGLVGDADCMWKNPFWRGSRLWTVPIRKGVSQGDRIHGWYLFFYEFVTSGL
jgi:hypothetical protein